MCTLQQELKEPTIDNVDRTQTFLKSHNIIGFTKSNSPIIYMVIFFGRKNIKDIIKCIKKLKYYSAYDYVDISFCDESIKEIKK